MRDVSMATALGPRGGMSHAWVEGSHGASFASTFARPSVPRSLGANPRSSPEEHEGDTMPARICDAPLTNPRARHLILVAMRYYGQGDGS